MKKKLTEQVLGTATLVDYMSAASTTAHVSSSIDREGYLSAYVVCQASSKTSDSTDSINFYIYDSSDDSTFAIYDSANSTVTITSISTSSTMKAFSSDLSGAHRYIKIYATVSALTTITSVISASVILGDGVIEPSV